MQRPGWDPADPPSPSPWAAAPDDASRTRVADGGRPAGAYAGPHGAPAGPPPGASAAPQDPYGPPADPHGRLPGPEARPPGQSGQSGPAGQSGQSGPFGQSGQSGPYHQPGPYDQPGADDPAGPQGPPSGQTGWWPAPARHRPVWPPTRRELTTALAAIVALAALGAALALLWVRSAPRLAFRVVEPGRALPVVPEAEEYVAADGRFVLITLVAGALAGLVCWLLRASRGPVVLVGLALGGLLGAVVTWRLGLVLEPGFRPEDLQQVGRTVYQPLELGARAALVVQPSAAVLVYLLAVGFTAHNDLGRTEEPPPVS